MKTSMACTGMLSYENNGLKLSKTAKTTKYHSSRARGTGFCLQTSMLLTINMNIKVAVELYYIFTKILKFGY